MRAQSLQCNLLGPCNAHCPFCIARMTWKSGVTDNQRLFDGMDRAFRFAKHHQVDTVMITSTGEPTLVDGVLDLVQTAYAYGFPSIELQTNGRRIVEEPNLLNQFVKTGLTGVAVSIASPVSVRNRELTGVTHDYLDLMSFAEGKGLLCRVALNLVAGEINAEELGPWADTLVSRGVHQLTLRELAIPEFNAIDGERSSVVQNWVRLNGMGSPAVRALRTEVATNGTLIRQNSFGVDIYDYHGLSTAVATKDATCMARGTDPNEIRAMILQPDGHCYSSWQLPGSILI